ncbi:CPXCG motif-containing cysteine-rich protein, partial [Vibrio parahaemolyticus]|nr:CPXCG motif-containing cysteine-rich protein [Vibrio parahaemolyticus]
HLNMRVDELQDKVELFIDDNYE